MLMVQASRLSRMEASGGGKWLRTYSWSVHNLFGAPHNKVLSGEFTYRHMKGISNNWKYNRWEDAAFDAGRFIEDAPLRAAFVKAGLLAG